MARWGKMTARGCFTMTEKHKDKLRRLAFDTEISESKHVRNALDLYFEQLEVQKQDEQPDMERVSDV